MAACSLGAVVAATLDVAALLLPADGAMDAQPVMTEPSAMALATAMSFIFMIFPSNLQNDDAQVYRRTNTFITHTRNRNVVE